MRVRVRVRVRVKVRVRVRVEGEGVCFQEEEVRRRGGCFAQGRTDVP